MRTGLRLSIKTICVNLIKSVSFCVELVEPSSALIMPRIEIPVEFI